jgi:hypothetical protein
MGMDDVRTPGEWLSKAAEARLLADALNDPGARQSMLLIAAGYVKMAGHAAALQDARSPVDGGDGC